MLTCKFEDGTETSLRHVVVDGIVTQNNQILLVKRSDDATLEPGKFALPGGFVERDETTRDAIKREVLEETGFETQIKELFGIVDFPDRRGEDRQNITFVYTLIPTEKVGESDHEIQSTSWFSTDELPSPNSIAFDHGLILQSYLENNDTEETPLINPYI